MNDQLNEATTSRDVTIAGEIFTLNETFATGHVLNEAEAAAMNQLRFENIRNNTASKVKAAKEGTAKEGDPTSETIAQFVADYAAAYQFTKANAGERRSADPIDREAIVVARELFKAALAKKNISYAKVEAEARDAKIAEIAAMPKVREEAKSRVKARQKAAEKTLDMFDLDDISETAKPAGEAEPSGEEVTS